MTLAGPGKRAHLEVGGRTYAWIEPWAQLPDTDERRQSWPHTALTATEAGEILSFDPAERAIVTLDRDGRVLRSTAVDIDEAHGMTLVVENSVPYLWLAEASVGLRPEAGLPALSGRGRR